MDQPADRALTAICLPHRCVSVTCATSPRPSRSAGLVLVGFSIGLGLAGSATAAPTTTTVETKFGNLGDCGSGVFFCYIPPSVTVSVGDTVLWTDLSGSAHTVTRCDPQNCDGVDGGTGTDSPLDNLVAPGQDFSHTFTGPGTYVYYCQIHGYRNMNGLVTVASEETTTTRRPRPRRPDRAGDDAAGVGSPAHEHACQPAAVRATAASPTSAASPVDPVVTSTPLARTGADLRLLSVGLSRSGSVSSSCPPNTGCDEPRGGEGLPHGHGARHERVDGA